MIQEMFHWLHRLTFIVPQPALAYCSHRISHDSESLSPASRYFITLMAHHAQEMNKIQTFRLFSGRCRVSSCSQHHYCTDKLSSLCSLAFPQIMKAEPKNTCCTFNTCDQICLQLNKTYDTSGKLVWVFTKPSSQMEPKKQNMPITFKEQITDEKEIP